MLEQYFKRSHLIFTALTNLLALPLIWAYLPGMLSLDRGSILLMMLSGVLLMAAMVFYLRALQFEEASVVAPFFQAAPLFGYALGYAVPGEVLSPMQLLGATLIMLGTLAASIELKRQERPKLNARLSLLMLVCALAVALSTLIFEVFALRDEFWTTTFWMFAGQAASGCAILAFPSFRGEFFRILRSSPGAVMGINATNELINLEGGLGTRYALVLAPMSLVQAVGSATTVFGVALSLPFPALGREDLSRQELTRKGAAALGVAFINR